MTKYGFATIQHLCCLKAKSQSYKSNAFKMELVPELMTVIFLPLRLVLTNYQNLDNTSSKLRKLIN